MSVNARVEIVGVKETIRSLSKIDKEVRRQFTRDARLIVAPIVDDAKRSYPEQLLSGMSRGWQQRGRKILPYDRRAATRGVRFKVDAGRRATTVVKVVQSNPAASIVEFAGSRSSSAFARNLTKKFRPFPRFMWPAAERHLSEVEDRMRDLIRVASRRVQREVG